MESRLESLLNRFESLVNRFEQAQGGDSGSASVSAGSTSGQA